MSKIEAIRRRLSQIELNLESIALTKSRYVSPADIDPQLTKDELYNQRERQQCLDEIAALEKESIVPAGPNPPLSKPPAHKPAEVKAAPFQQYDVLKNIHVDREEELKTFEAMLEGRHSNLHVLLIRAASGMGKTALMNKYWNSAQHLRRIRLDCKNSEMSFTDMISEMAQLDEPACRQLRLVYNELSKNMRLPDQTSFRTMASFVESALGEMSHQKQDICRGMIIDALLTDLQELYRNFAQPILIIIDTFEKASEEVKQWIARKFLGKIRMFPWLICVIAGQEIPSVESDEQDWLHRHELGVLEDGHIREYIKLVKPTVSEELMVFIVIHSRGVPHKLQQCALSCVNY